MYLFKGFYQYLQQENYYRGYVCSEIELTGQPYVKVKQTTIRSSLHRQLLYLVKCCIRSCQCSLNA